MARPLRLQSPHAWYHITSRGNERRAIYRDDRDREHFLELLSLLGERFACRLHAYVLMENHYHLLLETTAANLSQTMHWLNVSYTVWFNRRHGRSGHLLQGRYGAVVVDPQEWGLGLSRYFHLNPVRLARLKLSKAEQRRQRRGLREKADPQLILERLRQLRDYRWSSYRAYAGYGARPAWLETERVLSLGGASQSRNVIVRYQLTPKFRRLSPKFRSDQLFLRPSQTLEFSSQQPLGAGLARFLALFAAVMCPKALVHLRQQLLLELSIPQEPASSHHAPIG